MPTRDPDKLISAFRHMVENVNQAVHDAEETLAPTIDSMVHNAKDLAREIHTLTREEADMLSDVLKRDIRKANQVLNQQGKDLKQWIDFDLQLAEDKFIDLVAKSADKSWLDFHEFGQEDHQASHYRSGEVCNPGTLSCSECGKRLTLTEIGQIPTCPGCENKSFYRVIG